MSVPRAAIIRLNGDGSKGQLPGEDFKDHTTLCLDLIKTDSWREIFPAPPDSYFTHAKILNHIHASDFCKNGREQKLRPNHSIGSANGLAVCRTAIGESLVRVVWEVSRKRIGSNWLGDCAQTRHVYLGAANDDASRMNGLGER